MEKDYGGSGRVFYGTKRMIKVRSNEHDSRDSEVGRKCARY
jgi:hypothetical protein